MKPPTHELEKIRRRIHRCSMEQFEGLAFEGMGVK
jgi:hypothetical protein